MQIRDGIVDAIGHTPLIKLNRASQATGCTILGKAEFMNPGGSVKDRAGKQMILEAEKRGELRPGGLVVEATAGNTGIGLALVANARGYRTIIVIPQTQSEEKKDALRLYGAELVQVPALPFSNPNNYQHIGRRLAEQLKKTEKNGCIFADQWNNLDNSKAHYASTAPEIWDDTGGRIDGFVCAVGSGGTLAGVSRFREKNKDVVTAVADPRGAAMYNLFAHGEAKASEGGSITEGIGLGRVTGIVKQMIVDKAYLIPDEEALPIVFDLMEHEGLCLGGSSGINVAGAIRLAKDLGPGHTVVTVLADSGARYQSKLFNPEFLRSKKLPVPDWLTRKTDIAIPFEKNVMPTDCLFRDDSYLKQCDARVMALTGQGGIVLDRTVFYANSGGQPGDIGALATADGTRIAIENAIYTDAAKSEIALVPAPGSPALNVGDAVTAAIDWDKRYARMRMHTALHLLSAALPYAVTGGSVGEAESRLDFDIPEAGLDKDAITAKVNEMIATGAAVSSRWISDAELDANPGLVKTMSVKPPMGTGRVRLIEIAGLDLQPCGGTHVRNVKEIGAVRVTQIEKKGKLNRRVRLALA